MPKHQIQSLFLLKVLKSFGGLGGGPILHLTILLGLILCLTLFLLLVSLALVDVVRTFKFDFL